VSLGKENAFGQRPLSDMQIARFIPSEVNEKRDVLQWLKSARGREQLGTDPDRMPDS
jgi:hypothetical protein